ncbi:hypothetical protein GQ43DRAFT_415114 [Delitschia confertaspora ATCC 74209]|uniref:Uncharacterized protein n=1 Tax=Delitschia confertaspora ATCC 74209 TaxID=1513339 RepID=A0A9P4JMC8_9PLEO|nr:hypothetical protein GQ43DRAFT_415114 [Delitschia confertaspora ATCC 74209]
MPVWPFGRRGSRPAKLKEGRPTEHAEGKRPAHDSPNDDALRRATSRRSKRRKKRASNSTASNSTRNLHRSSSDLPPVNAPFARRNSRPPNSAEDITALPYSRRLEVSPHLRPVTGDHSSPHNFQRSISHSSLPTARERGKLQRPQSLRDKRAAAHESALTRRKSSRRRKSDHAREEEIRAMTMPLPQKRPAGGFFRRESKKIKNRHSERPTSSISLPQEESIYSSMSSGSESRAFRVSALDMFSPRPKIRSSVGSQQYYPGVGDSPPRPTRADSKKERQKLIDKEGENWKRSKRIDDLADSLDAGALREILDRDKRRRERKLKADEERIRRKLERRAEKQRESEQQAGTPAMVRDESRGAVGLGLEHDPSTPMEDVRPSTPPQPQQIRTGPIAPSENGSPALPTPMESPVEEPVVADARAIRYSRASLSGPATSPTPGHAREPSNVSQMPGLLSEMTARERPAEVYESIEDPRTSGPLHPIESIDTMSTAPQKSTGRRRSSEGRRMRMWASIFRRGSRRSKDPIRNTPSEASFSNTSRESMARQPPPAHLVQVSAAPVPIRRPSAVPKRTMSKFREDLPEYPLSPPDSRMQSPEVASSSPIAARRRSRPLSHIQVDGTNPTVGGSRTDSPVSPGVPAVGLMSQSLASVDSEGSWLSGKPLKRRSNRSHMQSSIASSSHTARQGEDFNASYEELGIPDDEYFRRLTPQPDELRRSAYSGEGFTRKPSSTAMAAMTTTSKFDDHQATPISDGAPPEEKEEEEEEEGEEEGVVDDDDEKLVQDSVGRHPTVVHRHPRVKSTEGLLSYFTAGAGPATEQTVDTEMAEDGPESPASDTEPTFVQRARSVDLGKHHVRHLSAGSAKLLDIPAKRPSVDQKRLSNASPNQTSKAE